MKRLEEENHLCEAILQIVYEKTEQILTEQILYSWIKGTSFVIRYQEKLFVITVSHCIYDDYLEYLFLSKMSTRRNLFSIPINKQIKSYDDRCTRIDNDLRILKINDEEFNKNILQNAQIKTPDEYSNEIMNMPFVQKIKRKYKRNPIKFREKLLS